MIINREQNRGYKHKGWKNADDMQSSEKMTPRRANYQNDQTIITRLHIGRKIDLGQPGVAGIREVIDTVKSNNPKFVEYSKDSITKIDELGITYFGKFSFQNAIRRSHRKDFALFGKDPKATRDTVTKLKGSFIDFLKDSRFIQAFVEDPVCLDEFDLEVLSYGNSEEARDYAKKWSETSVKIEPTILALDGNGSQYFAFDLNQNDVLHEEKNSIQEFFQTEHGLMLEDPKHERDGRLIPHRLHSTFAKVSLDDLVLYDFNIPELPNDFAFPARRVEFEARSYSGHRR